MPHNDSHSSKNDIASTRDGTLLALVTGGLFVLFTLLPNSSTLMVSWPWVFVWQIALALPILWLIWQLWQKPLNQFVLGHGADWVVAVTVVGLILSSLLTEFPQQARWYSWAAFGGIAALYALSGWLTSAARCQALLRWQGGVALAFIVISLGLWVSQIYLPELDRLQALQAYGVNQSFSFRLTSLQNWQPMGHQNYVAGYLVLVLPLLAGLAVSSKNWQRWLWAAGFILGLVNLYTTSSRGGWVALFMAGVMATGLALVYSRLPRWVVLAVGGGTATFMLTIALTNNRLQAMFASLARGDFASSALAYRAITNTVGWRMGLSDPFTGLGPGAVPLVYQRYRPFWAGREAEMQYQLHSTPAQLWGELGIWGIAAALAVLVWLIVIALIWGQQTQATEHSPEHPWLGWSLLVALLAYGVMALTDYQLSMVAIGGTLIMYLAVLARMTNPQPVVSAVKPDRYSQGIAAALLGLWIVMSLWLVPVHRAWATASSGFEALFAQKLEPFVDQLQKAQALAPWQPYYPYQLGWNLGEISNQLEASSPVKVPMQQDAIAAFQTANQIMPAQEFGHSNLGWLLLNQEPPAAAEAFAQSAQLVPAKQGVFMGLGVALALANQPEPAIEALTLELLRHPMTLVSPVWQQGVLATLRDEVMANLEQAYTALLQANPGPEPLVNYLHQVRGALRWWRGDFAAASADWQISGTAVSRAILALAQDQPVDVGALPDVPGRFAIQAWLTPAERQALLSRAWATSSGDVDDLSVTLPPPELINYLVASMAQATSLDDWLKRIAPAAPLRNDRLGFGVLMRQIDGPAPTDYYTRIENIPMVQFFNEVLPSPVYFPALDQALQPLRESLLSHLI
jgi:uncharacterized protein involved in response to NO